MTARHWYVTPNAGHGTHGQSSVNNGSTGATVAVVYGDSMGDDILIANAPDLLDALESSLPGGAHEIPWVCNAAITQDIEALRAICIAYAKWNNEVLIPAVANARGAA
jgi:hypothetical protein